MTRSGLAVTRSRINVAAVSASASASSSTTSRTLSDGDALAVGGDSNAPAEIPGDGVAERGGRIRLAVHGPRRLRRARRPPPPPQELPLGRGGRPRTAGKDLS